jgi:isocitrate dehydrogenase
MYWAQELANQNDNAELKAVFTPYAEALTANENTIVEELIAVQGKPADIGGYYFMNEEKATMVMRPSKTLNEIVDAF